MFSACQDNINKLKQISLKPNDRLSRYIPPRLLAGERAYLVKQITAQRQARLPVRKLYRVERRK